MAKPTSARAKLYTTIAFKAASLILCVRAFFVVWNMGSEWRGAINDVDVFTIHMDRFWGPVHMLVPNNCTDLREKIANQEKSHQEIPRVDVHYSSHEHHGDHEDRMDPADHEDRKDGNSTHRRILTREDVDRAIGGHVLRSPLSPSIRGQDQDGQRSALGFHRLPDAVSPCDFANFIEVEMCDLNILSDDPTKYQKYFAMIYLQPERLWNWFSKTKAAHDTISEMKFLRTSLYFVLFFGIITDWMLQVVLNAALIKEIARPRGAHAGVQYKEIQTQQRSWWQMVRMYLGLFPRQCLYSCWSMSQQGCLLTLYITYWDENHYLMNYIPGCGLLAIYSLIFFFFLLALAKKVNDKCFECASAAVCCYICILVPAVVVPMLVWLGYNLNFLYQSNIHGVMHDVVQPEFPSAEHNAKVVSFGVIGVNLLEMALSPAIEVFYSK